MLSAQSAQEPREAGVPSITYRSNCEFSTAKCQSLGQYGVELTGYSLSEALIFDSINITTDCSVYYDFSKRLSYFRVCR